MELHHLRSVSLARTGSIFAALVLTVGLAACGGGGGGGTSGVPGLIGGTIQSAPLSLTGTVTTFAGTGTSGSADGTGTAASFYEPAAITTDGTNLYVADFLNNEIRKIVIATGVVTTFAGSTTPGSANGTGSSAQFSSPAGITTDGKNLYVADNGNCNIRKIVIATAKVTTLAGTAGTCGDTDGTGAAASFFSPYSLTMYGKDLYVSDYGNNNIRKIVIGTGVVTTLAGSTSGVGGSTDGTGTLATFSGPLGITTDGTNLYVAEYSNDDIREINIATGVVTTLAGSGTAGSADGTGTAASFNGPLEITTDGTNLYVAGGHGNNIRQIVTATGVVTTLAGSGTAGSTDGTGTSATFNYPWGITTDGTSLYVSTFTGELIRKIQ